MSDHTNSDSDPLPFAQVDRAVKPKAATLATMVGVTYQHALGSLAEFWEACGDPRELERLWAQGKDEVVLSRDEVAGRLLVAFGRPVDPDACRHLGLLETRPEGFRVRGMSRYFAPIKERVVTRQKASAGGKASVAARRKKHGSAQPGLAAGSASGSAVVRTSPEPAPNPNDVRSGDSPNLPEASVIGHRSSDSGHRPPPPAPDDEKPVVVVEPVGSPDPDPADALWAWMAEARNALGYAAELERPPGLADWLIARHAEGRTDRAISDAYVLYLRDEDFRARGWPTAIFLSDKIWRQRMRGPKPPREVRL